MLSSALLKKNFDFAPTSCRDNQYYFHKLATIWTIVNNSDVQPNLGKFRHHFSLDLEIEYIVVMSFLVCSDGVPFQIFAYQLPNIWIKDNPNKNMNSFDLIRINNQHRNGRFLHHVIRHTTKYRVLQSFTAVCPHNQQVYIFGFNDF